MKEKRAGNFKGNVGFPRFKSKKHGLVGSFRLTGAIRIFERHIQWFVTAADAEAAGWRKAGNCP